jgi:hypothetical protein
VRGLRDNGAPMPDGHPRIELLAPASPEEAAAVVAAIERFMRATAAPAAAPAAAADGWREAALLEGVSRDPGEPRAHPWINT